MQNLHSPVCGGSRECISWETHPRNLQKPCSGLVSGQFTKKNTNWNFKTFNKYRSSVQTMMAVENRKTTILWSSNLGPGKTPGISKFQSLHTKPTDHPPLSTSTKQRWRLWLWGWRLQPTNWWCKPTSSWSQSSPSSLIFVEAPTQHGKKTSPWQGQ